MLVRGAAERLVTAAGLPSGCATWNMKLTSFHRAGYRVRSSCICSATLYGRSCAAHRDEIYATGLSDRYQGHPCNRHRRDLQGIAADRIERPATVRECRDPKDDKYLALALAGKAAAIVSSDVRHMLSMHPWRGIQILSPADYLALKEA